MDLQLAALGFALAEVDHGVRETGGNNQGERIREYLEGAGITSAAPWCASFVDYCVDFVTEALRVANPIADVQLEAYVQNYADRLGHMVTVDPTEGALVLFSFGGERWDHIGFVLNPPNAEGFFRTVEGNTSDESERDGDAVAIKRRTLGTGTREPMFIQWGTPPGD